MSRMKIIKGLIGKAQVINKVLDESLSQSSDKIVYGLAKIAQETSPDNIERVTFDLEDKIRQGTDDLAEKITDLLSKEGLKGAYEGIKSRFFNSLRQSGRNLSENRRVYFQGTITSVLIAATLFACMGPPIHSNYLKGREKIIQRVYTPQEVADLKRRYKKEPKKYNLEMLNYAFAKADHIHPEIPKQLAKLPMYGDGNTPEETDGTLKFLAAVKDYIKILEDMVGPWVNMKGYSAALEELLKGFTSGEYGKKDNPLVNGKYNGWFKYTIERWDDMKGKEWDDFYTVVGKLSHPRLIQHWINANLRPMFEIEEINYTLSPEQVFERVKRKNNPEKFNYQAKEEKAKIDCEEFAITSVYFADKNGWHSRVVDNVWGVPGTMEGHAVGAFRIGKDHYKFGDTNSRSISKPFKSYEEIGLSINSSGDIYIRTWQNELRAVQ